MDCFILKDRKPVAASIAEWCVWFESRDSIVAVTDVGSLSVSTVFIGLASQVINPTPFFETMIFKNGHRYGTYQHRCATWEEAEAAHAEAILVAKKSNH